MLFSKAKRRLFFPGIALLILAVAILAGCGFKPVHQPGGKQSVQQELGFVSVAIIAGRIGLILRNRLLEKLTPGGESDVPRYRLSVQLGSTTEALLIQLDNTVTRNNLKMNAKFVLRDISADENVYTDSAYSVGSYNVVDSEFATAAAEKNAADRVAREVGEEIFDLLVIYFNGAKL